MSTSTDWTNRACADTDPNLFHPAAKDRASVIRAKRICATCPIRSACLEGALKAEAADPSSKRYGVFGGLTGEERDQLPQAKRRIRKPPLTTTPETEAKRTRLHELAARGLGIDEVCRALNTDRKPLWNWCHRNHELATYRQLVARSEAAA